jgi:hypothetical protein
VSFVLPDRFPLDPPEENAAALAEAIEGVSGAAFRLGLLDVHLAGPAALAPGWLGRDAAAAAAQIAAVVGLARDVHGALTQALDRLEQHADLLDAVRARIAALRRQQEEDFDAAAARLAALVSSASLPAPPGEPAPIVALRGELAAAEAARRHEHGALLAEVRSDAVDTAHALAAATAVVGGNGRRGEGSRVIAHLAAALPGWGDGELAARGAELARRLLGPGTPDEFAAWARDAEPYAGTSAFADALLATIGPEMFRAMLDVIYLNDLGAQDALPRLLARALGAAGPGDLEGDPVAAVLGGRYVDPDDVTRQSDARAVALGVLLAADARSGFPGVPLPTVAAWGRQVLDREARLRRGADPYAEALWRGGLPGKHREEPVAWVLRVLSQGNDSSACAALLADRSAWKALLGRPAASYLDGGYDLRQVVALAGAAHGPAGETAVRSGLEALGTGLSDGDPDHWPADRGTAASVAFSLAEGVAAHVTVATGGINVAGVGGTLDAMPDAALRGLGVIALDPSGSAVIQQALGTWALAQTTAGDPLAAAAVVGGFVAVRQYGQRLAYALHGFEQRDDALARKSLFDWTVGLLQFAPGPVGAAAVVLTPLVAHVVGADGTWDNGRDTGLTFGPEDSAAAALVQLGGPEGSTGEAIGQEARRSFVLTTCVLGLPLPPDSPEWDVMQALIDSVPFPDKRAIWDGAEAIFAKAHRAAG